MANSNSSKKLILFGILVTALVGSIAGRMYLMEWSKKGYVDKTPLKKAEINAPFITSLQEPMDKMVELAELKPDDLVYDLGCGDGRIVINAVVKTGCRGVGIDIEPQRIKESIENATKQGVADRIEFREQDVFTVDLSECNVAMMYLTGWMVEKLEKQFEQMKPGSKVIMQDYWLEQVRPERAVAVKGVDPEDPNRAHMVYLYTVPLKRDPKMERGKPPQPADALNPAQ